MIVNDDIEDSAELFVVKFLYNLLIYTLFLRKIPMVSTKSRFWLDTRRSNVVKETGAECLE
jgi:hypothetical protein